MKTGLERGRLLFLATATAIILERLVFAGLVLYDQAQFKWTSFLMPVTHVAVVVFLIYTADLLIYWLVILWGLVTSGTFAYNLWEELRKLSPEHKSQVWTSPTAMVVIGLAVFHLVTILVLLSGPVRKYLAKRREALDAFEDALPTETTGPGRSS
jgi:hypothetical protein